MKCHGPVLLCWIVFEQGKCFPVGSSVSWCCC